jgi:tRNA splicing endonuclease
MLRYRVFELLWERGFYLTNALKFGGDYLAYPGE